MVGTAEVGLAADLTFSREPIVPKFPVVTLAEADRFLTILLPLVEEFTELLQEFRYGQDKKPKDKAETKITLETTLLNALDGARLRALESGHGDEWTVVWSEAIQAVDHLAVRENGKHPIVKTDPILFEVRKAARCPNGDVAANLATEATARAIRTNAIRSSALESVTTVGTLPQLQLFLGLDKIYQHGAVNLYLANVEGTDKLVAHLPTLTPEGDPALACLIQGDKHFHAYHPWSVYCRNLHPFPGNPQPPRKIYALETLR